MENREIAGDGTGNEEVKVICIGLRGDHRLILWSPICVSNSMNLEFWNGEVNEGLDVEVSVTKEGNAQVYGAFEVAENIFSSVNVFRIGIRLVLCQNGCYDREIWPCSLCQP